MRSQPIVLPSEVGEFADELRQIFLELGPTSGLDALAGECSPPLDVYETDETIEILMDLPGVDAGALRILVKDSVMLVAGKKVPRRGRGDSSFHLMERGFGRFARTVRLSGAFDPGKARASIAHGELRVTVPKIADRRGRAIRIAVAADADTQKQ